MSWFTPADCRHRQIPRPPACLLLVIVMMTLCLTVTTVLALTLWSVAQIVL